MDTAVPASSPGALLREARQAKGMDLDTLALSIKVAPRKLEALESDRYDELPDPGFVRALALTVCRVLGRDPADVLAGLPAVSQGAGLEHVTRGLDQPFDRTGLRLGALVETKVPQFLRPSVVVPVLLLAAAAAIWLLWPQRLAPVDTPAPQAAAATEVVAAVEPGTRVESVSADAASAAAVAADAASAASMPAAAALTAPAVTASVQPGPALDLRASSRIAPAAPAASLATAVPAALSPVAAAAVAPASAAEGAGPVIATREASWIEARDSRGRTVVSRLLQPGERVALEGRAPWKIKVGNARGTDLSYNGKPVDLQPLSRDNVVRLELK